jgi:RNA polymerase sigma factor (sigma-70 family)
MCQSTNQETIRDENVVFQEYLENPVVAEELYSLLKAHAYAIVHQEGIWGAQQDIVNEACWHAMQLPTRFRGEAKFSTWFQQIVLNLCVDERRRLTQRKEDSLEVCKEPLSKAPLLTVSEEVLQGLLPEEQRLLRLRLDGASHAETAETFGITTSGARTRWLRLIKKLKGELSAGR